MAAAKRFEIRAVGQRDPDAHDEAACFRLRRIDVAQLDASRLDEVPGAHAQLCVISARSASANGSGKGVGSRDLLMHAATSFASASSASSDLR